MPNSTKREKVVVVGAGPVGALATLYAASRGDDVEVYELRDGKDLNDLVWRSLTLQFSMSTASGYSLSTVTMLFIRALIFSRNLHLENLRNPSTTPLNFTKSINLALSERGINSMRQAKCEGLLDAVLKETIPMHGRMIHGTSKGGDLYEESQAYDAQGRYIRAVDRAGLNKRLLDQLEQMPNVKMFFNHKLTGADFNRNTAWFEQRRITKTDHAQNPTENTSVIVEPDRPKEIAVDFDFLIGADGAHSATRYHLMKFARLSYQQEYIDTLWCEFHITPKASDGSFAISPNHLHIWPGGSFMFIAIPSLDGSFTCTLFAPGSYFSFLAASSDDEMIASFSENFPGVCPELISTSELVKQFDENPHLPLISIKCTPYHYQSSVVIIGDAAHAMVPFYGQGMNAGLEDVRVLFDFLDTHDVYDDSSKLSTTRRQRREGALNAYTIQRTPDAAAINDLALRNYEEMRSGVTSPIYRARKWLEETINLYLPGLGWRTQYTRALTGKTYRWDPGSMGTSVPTDRNNQGHGVSWCWDRALAAYFELTRSVRWGAQQERHLSFGTGILAAWVEGGRTSRGAATGACGGTGDTLSSKSAMTLAWFWNGKLPKDRKSRKE
ncbi:MAG: hypothetical protein Q9219_001861 [cf. Caloplaca sp. 3 TL-2023]